MFFCSRTLQQNYYYVADLYVLKETLPEPPFIEPKSIWRKMPLNEIAIPDGTYELAKNETVVTSAEKVEVTNLSNAILLNLLFK